MRSRDTSAEVYGRQIELYRSMSPGRRAAIAADMSEEVLDVAADGIRARHPDYDDDDVTWALLRLRLGTEVFRRVWPAAPLLAP